MMKGILVALFLGICSFFSANLTFGQNPGEYSKVVGTVLLPTQEPAVSVGGRYGRPSRGNTSSKSAPDSVLIWIAGNSASSDIQPEMPVVLDQQDLSFTPSVLVVRQNGTVRIQNSDPVYHNVFSLSPIKRFDVGRRPKGEYLDVTFDKPGAVDVFCDIHSNMRATIYVMPPEAITWIKSKNGESFTIENMPTGSYELKIYALGYQEQSIPIEVHAGEPTDIGTITLR